MNILLSIKPKYAKKIFSGEKTYEFRKQKPKEAVDMVLVYECHPSKKIVGGFTVKKILYDSPKKIWEKCKNSSGIQKKEFFYYCRGKKFIYAFEIDRTFLFDTPLNPFELYPDFIPPQSFSYLINSPINGIKKWEEDYR